MVEQLNGGGSVLTTFSLNTYSNLLRPPLLQDLALCLLHYSLCEGFESLRVGNDFSSAILSSPPPPPPQSAYML